MFQEHIQVCGDIVLKTFDELTVRLTLDSSNLQHRKLVFQLVRPCVPGFSYQPDDAQMDVEVLDVETTEVKKSLKTPNKRKNTDSTKKKKLKK